MNDIPFAALVRDFIKTATSVQQSWGAKIAQIPIVAQVNIGNDRKCLVQSAS